MKSRKKYLFLVLFLILASGFFNLSSPQAPPKSAATQAKDTVKTIFPVAKTTPQTYQEVKNVYPIDLPTPENFKSDFEYNPQTNRYELRNKIGNEDVSVPITLTREEYYKYSLQKSMDLFYKDKYAAEFDSLNLKKNSDALSAFDFKVNIGPADKIFGPGGVRLTANGSLTTKLGFTRRSAGDPTLTERQRNRTAFDFDSQIQAVVKASVGDKLNFDMNYNTESTFDFDTKKLNLGYVGKEDEILKVLEAGNVSMNTTNSLIRGGAALFGIHTQMQFGKLTVDAVFSQQESQSRSISSKGNLQTTAFEVTADKYDEKMHYFLGHYFYDHYDEAMKTLPYINSPISIDRVEVWVINQRSSFNEVRNIVAFTDLGEHNTIGNSGFIHPTGENLPYNAANDLYTTLNRNYEGARNISTVDQTLGSIMTEHWDYEKIGNSRRLDPSEYTLNRQLGYISLRYPMQDNDVLAVAYSYMYQGASYQVGEFSTDDPSRSKENLYVKLIKGTDISTVSMTWKLMMKNVYAITANNQSLTQEKFRLNIKYRNDTIGGYLNYITEGKIANQLLLRVERLDRLDSRNEPHPDGFFDFVPGYTVIPEDGKIIFPVVEPFGSHLRKMIGDDRIADKYVFQELYDTTQTAAQQTAEQNKFILAGEYKGSNASNINLSGMNIAKGSVTVTANGVRLKENVDYILDYASGQVTIINPLYENANIQTSSEDRSNFGMQRKTMMGMNLNYAVNKQFNIGATIMRLSEMPLTMKTEPGQESIANTLFGFNVNYTTQSQLLTNLLDKIPMLELTAPSQITFTAEYAHLIPGHYKSKYGGNYSYIDDFEQAKQIIDLRSPYAWNLSSTPSMFGESKKVNDTDYGKNRSLLAWYRIDALFTRKSSLTPTHIKNDLEQLSNHYVREILESELFPSKDATFGESASLPVLNLAFYPNERGPYNLDATGTNPDGKLREPEKRWGGITRRIENGNTNFEANNIDILEFWLMDPFIGKENAHGGDLYFNLGEISEDILKDGKKFFENGLPVDTANFFGKVDTTVWGLVPKQQSLVYAFDNVAGAREKQDVGFDGLPTKGDGNIFTEYNYPTYARYLAELNQVLSPETKEAMQNDPFSPLNDPAGDDYHYFRGNDYDNQQLSILERYKHYNGMEGNSAEASNGGNNTASRLVPDVEDINQDNTLNEVEKYFQYRIAIHPDSMIVGRNYIVQKLDVKPILKNGKSETVSWYQFKVPLSEFEKKIGSISDFRTIRFIRMFLTNFSDSVVLRFGTLQFSYGQWRVYTKDLFDPQKPPQGNGNISMSTVNIEENGSKEPVNYVMPPGVNRILDPGQTQLRQQNEQSMSLLVTNLSQGDSRAIYKSTSLDTRQYRRLQMFTHAEKTLDMPTNLQDNDLSVFIRLGSDYKNNYYEYEVPLRVTPPGRYTDATEDSRKTVWPESNMIDFKFDLLTNLKLQRNKEKRKAGSDVTYNKPFSIFDPDKPMNTVRVVGNPTISDIRVIMIGVRNNNSLAAQSAEVWLDELRLTDFNEDGGWAGNANLFVGLSDMGSVSFSGRKETAGFGSLDQGIMDRNIDDVYQYNISSQLDLGRFFPEKAKIHLPFYYSYTEDVISPKYNPLDQDVLLKDAIDAMDTQAERDSINSIAQNKKTTKSIAFNGVKTDIKSKKPMPYDPANFTFDYSHVEDYLQDAITQREQTIADAANLHYAYSSPLKSWKPFDKTGQKPKEKEEPSQKKPSSGQGSKFLKNIEIGFLPKTLEINLERTRNYYEVQLRDLGDLGGSTLPPSFRDDFYWNRSLRTQWNLTKNLNLNFNSGTNARIRTLEDITEDNLMPNDEYLKKKKSVLQDIKDMGDPMDYKQDFTGTYTLPFNMIPALGFIKGALSYKSGYQWQRGATLNFGEDGPETNIQMGNIISNTRTIGLDNVNFDLLTLYNKSKFLSDANKRFTPSKTGSTSIRNVKTTGARVSTTEADAKKAELEKRKKKYEGSVTLKPDTTTTLVHQLNNKRLRIIAKDERGKSYDLKYKAIDNNSIRIQNKDSVSLKVVISQLPPLEDESWYKNLQVVARGLMMVRSFGFSYAVGNDMMIPNFRHEIGNFFGQASVGGISAPGWDFAFGLTGEDYVERAAEKGWLEKNANDSRTAMFNKTGTFNFTATLEPVAGMRVALTATRTRTDRQQIYMSGANSSLPRQFTGNFTMTTISLGSAFESNNAQNGYQSNAFDAFLENRYIISNRLANTYSKITYPNAGFLQGDPIAGQPFDPGNGSIELNSTDVLIPAFIAAYTGQKAKSVGLSAFPALKKLLPNWKITYDGLLQIPFIKKNFKSFTLEHNYTSTYSVGAFNSFSSWVGADNEDGIGFIKNVTNNNPYPSSPYDITAVSIVEAFSPLLGVNSTLTNNMSLSLKYNTNRNINLNVSAYQIVESKRQNLTFGTGYRFENFNRVLKIRKTGGPNFNNEMKVSVDVSHNMDQTLIRKIEENLTQATSGNSQTMINFTADYSLSKLVILQAFYSRQVSKPLVSATAYPSSTSSFGVSVKVSLSR